MRVAVTGATGLVGANVVRALLADGNDVRVGVRATSKTLALDGLPVERVSFDLGDRAALERAFAGCDAVIHAAASVWVGLTGREETHLTNVGGTENVCAAAANAGVRRLVYVGTVSANGVRADNRPADEDVAYNLEFLGCAYAATKHAAQLVVDRYAADGLDAVTVCPTYMFGPWDTRPSSGTMILEVASGKARAAPPGVNDFVDVRDVATGVVAALHRGQRGRRYILGGVPMSYFDAWTRIARVVGAGGPWFVAPAPVVRAAGALGGVWTRISGREPEINPIAVRWSVMPNFWFDSSRAKAELGYPETDVDRAISDAWQWFGEHGYR
jgi:dihydroflavonol-4-reductase